MKNSLGSLLLAATIFISPTAQSEIVKSCVCQNDSFSQPNLAVLIRLVDAGSEYYFQDEIYQRINGNFIWVNMGCRRGDADIAFDGKLESYTLNDKCDFLQLKSEPGLDTKIQLYVTETQSSLKIIDKKGMTHQDCSLKCRRP